MTPVRLFARIVLAACLLAAPLIPTQPAVTTTTGESPLAGMHPEVRLRKLHLVRPDLIPYPIAFEVCC
jgi:hypothetical protein